MQTAATELTSSGLSEKRGRYLFPFTHQKSPSIKYSARSFPLNLFGHKQLWPSHYLVSIVPKCPWDYFCPLCQVRLPSYIRETKKTTNFTEKLWGTDFGFFSSNKAEGNQNATPVRGPIHTNIPTNWKQCFQVCIVLIPLINTVFLPTVPFPCATQVHVQELN